jgi:hypothetical protein
MFSLNLTCFTLHLSWVALELSTEVLADISKKVTDSGLLRIMMTNTKERAAEEDTSPGLRFVLIAILVMEEIIWCGTFVFSFFLLSGSLSFLPEDVVLGFEILNGPLSPKIIRFKVTVFLGF